MILIDKVFQAVNGLANKDQRSSLTPNVFNPFSAIALTDIIDDIRITIKNDKLGLVYGKLGMERLRYAQDALNYFYEIESPLTLTSGVFVRPSDLESIEDLFYNGAKIDRLQNYKHLSLLRKMGKHLTPDNIDQDGDSSAAMNIYYLPTASGYKVFPATVIANVTATYLRKWNDPKWTYTVINGTAVYNGSASDAQNFELPERFFDDLVWRIAIMAGINIRDNELINPLLAENKNEEKENVS